MLRNNMLATILLMLCCALGTYAQTEFSLEQAIDYALQHNKEIALEKTNVADAEGQINEYKSIGIPKINGSAKYTHFFNIPTSVLPDFLSPAIYGVLEKENLVDQTPEFNNRGIPAEFGTPENLDLSLDLNTLILDGSYFVGLRATKLYRDLVRKRVVEKEYNTKVNVTEAYLSVLIIKKNIDLLNDNINNLTKLYNETKAIYENGFAEKLDVDRLELSLQNLSTEQENLVRLGDIAKYALKFSMGFPLEKEITLSNTFDEMKGLYMIEKLDSKPSLDLSKRPESASFETALNLQDLNIKRIRFGYFPSLSGFASYGGSLQRSNLFDGNDNDWFKISFVGLQLSVPIFDGLEKKYNLQRAKINKQQTALQKSMFEDGVKMQYNSAWLKYVNACKKVENTEKSLQLAQNIYDVTQIKFKEGVGSSLEVSQAESDLYLSQSNYTNAVYDLILAKTELNSALGNL